MAKQIYGLWYAMENNKEVWRFFTKDGKIFERKVKECSDGCVLLQWQRMNVPQSARSGIAELMRIQGGSVINWDDKKTLAEAIDHIGGLPNMIISGTRKLFELDIRDGWKECSGGCYKVFDEDVVCQAKFMVCEPWEVEETEKMFDAIEIPETAASLTVIDSEPVAEIDPELEHSKPEPVAEIEAEPVAESETVAETTAEPVAETESVAESDAVSSNSVTERYRNMSRDEARAWLRDHFMVCDVVPSAKSEPDAEPETVAEPEPETTEIPEVPPTTNTKAKVVRVSKDVLPCGVSAKDADVFAGFNHRARGFKGAGTGRRKVVYVAFTESKCVVAYREGYKPGDCPDADQAARDYLARHGWTLVA